MCFLGEYLTLKLETASFLSPNETVIPSTNVRKKRKDEERSSPMQDVINMIDYLDDDESKCFVNANWIKIKLTKGTFIWWLEQMLTNIQKSV